MRSGMPIGCELRVQVAGELTGMVYGVGVGEYVRNEMYTAVRHHRSLHYLSRTPLTQPPGRTRTLHTRHFFSPYACFPGSHPSASASRSVERPCMRLAPLCARLALRAVAVT